VRERRIGASVVELVPFDLAARVDEVAQHRLGLLRRLAVDDVVVAKHDGRVLALGLGEQAQRQHGVGIFRAEQPAFAIAFATRSTSETVIAGAVFTGLERSSLALLGAHADQVRGVCHFISHAVVGAIASALVGLRP
jgi:hypothetical protein